MADGFVKTFGADGVESMAINDHVVKGIQLAIQKEILFSVLTPFTVDIGTLPEGAIVTDVLVDVTAAFNAGTTNVLVVGTAGTADLLVAAGDVNEANIALTKISAGAKMTAATVIKAKYTQTGTAASTGAATVTVLYTLMV